MNLYLMRGTEVLRLRALVVGRAIGAGTLLAFLIWNCQAILSGIVFQMQTPTTPRLGLTSLVALMATTTSVYPRR